MAEYSAGRITSWAWAQPNIDPVYRVSPQGSPVSTGLGDPHFAITIEWDWPEGDWSHFNIIRSVRSPARRFEEGHPMISADEAGSVLALKSKHPTTTSDGRPYYTDPQPPPGEWVYYTIFVLSPDRVWTPAGSVLEIGPADHDWTLRLPEFLPGASTTVEQGVAHPADQETDLVQFLQGPGVYMDTAVTMAEAVQFFWNPLRCPPATFEHLALSWGYAYADSLGLGRSREVLSALRRPSQGSIAAIQEIAEGATGCETVVLMSNNLLSNTSDSSFETGSMADTAWGPSTSLTGLELKQYSSLTQTDPKPIAPPNISYEYFLYIPNARTLWCGYGADKTNPDPVRYGVPIASWKKMRMGCYAYDAVTTPTEVKATLKMGMDLYDIDGKFIQSTTVLPQRDLLTSQWRWNGNGDALAPEPLAVEIVIPEIEETQPGVLTTPGKWTPSTLPGYAQPQTVAPVVASGMKLAWVANPTTSGDRAFWGVDDFLAPLVDRWLYRISITVKPSANAAPWRLAVAGRVASETQYPDSTGTAATVSFEWRCDGGDPHIGVEAQVPGGGWAAAGTHTVTALSVVRLPVAHAYGVPWITVGNACYIDLIVVDDG